MLIYGDNARLANQAINWLQNEKLQKVLILVDGSEHSSLDPSDVIVDVPPPTTDEVMDALGNLPPSAMLEFANSVATVVEDENMVNDFIHDSMDKVSNAALNRFYIFFTFGVVCLSFLCAFVFQRKLQRQTASEVAFQRSSREQIDLKEVQFRERPGKRIGHWPSFPTELDLGDDGESKSIFESMRKMSIQYKSQPTEFWSRKKLAKLEKEVLRWREHFKSESNIT